MEETTTPSNVQPEANDLQAQCLHLRKQVSSMLILLIVISVTFNAFLFYQYWLTRAALSDLRPQIGAIVAEYQQIGPRMDDFINKIRQYGNTHPDFGPTMVRYGLMTNAVQAAPSAPKK